MLTETCLRPRMKMNLLAMVAATLWIGPLSAFPPPQPESTPPGTIYGSYYANTWQMKADGSSAAAVTLTSDLNSLGGRDASFYVYGADGGRWWLTCEIVSSETYPPPSASWRKEIVAYRIPASASAPTGPRIQVSNFYPRIEPNLIKWSNGGDGFFSIFAATHVSTGVGPYLPAVPSVYRVEVSAASLEAGTLVQPVDVLDPRLTQPIPDLLAYGTTNFYWDEFEWDWSPDGTTLAFCHDHTNLWIKPFNAPATRIPGLARVGGVDWAYQGAKVAIQGTLSGQTTAGLYTVDASTSAIVPVKVDTAKLRHGAPAWSPDGRHIAATSLDHRGQYAIVRMKADGSGEISLGRPAGHPDRWASDLSP